MATAAETVGSHAIGSSGASASLTARRIVWVAAMAAAVVFFLRAATRYFVFTEASYRIFWPNRYWILLHAVSGSVALLCGLPQFSARLRESRPAVHRWTGRLYLTGVALGVVSAWNMSFHSVIGWTFGVATFFLGLAWVITTGMALLAILRRRVAAHREWMIRSYVVTFAFVFFRVLFVSPLFADAGTRLERMTSFLWMSFVVPLLVTEVVLQLPRLGARQLRAS